MARRGPFPWDAGPNKKLLKPIRFKSAPVVDAVSTAGIDIGDQLALDAGPMLTQLGSVPTSTGTPLCSIALAAAM